MREQWRPVVGYEGCYEVSDLGRVRSMDRVINNPLPSGAIRRQRITGKVLKPRPANCGGYPYVNLSLGNKRQGTRHVHRLVMDAFIGPRPKGMQTRHLNGDPTDNRLRNLAYGTPKENAADRYRHGTAGWTDECKRGHPRSPENTRWSLDRKGNTKRDCRACARDRHHNRKTRAA